MSARPKPTAPVQAVGYVRISKADRDRTETDQRLSMRQQADTIRAACKAKGWDLLCIHEDFALSGADDARPGFGAVAAMVEAGEADVVVVRHVDRLYRKAWRLLRLVDSKDNDGKGWNIYSVEQAFDTREPEGWFAFAQFALFGDFERRLIGKRTRLALAQLRREGKHTGRPSLIPDEVVERIYDLNVRQGLSARAVAALLEAEGVPRPTPDCKGWNHGHVLGAVERVNVQRNGAALATLL